MATARMKEDKETEEEWQQQRENIKKLKQVENKLVSNFQWPNSQLKSIYPKGHY